MKMSRTTILIAAGVILVAVAVFVFIFQRGGVPSVPGAPEEQVVARIGNRNVTQPRLDDYLRYKTGFREAQPDVSEELRQAALDELIEYELLQEEAARSGIEVTESDITAYFAERHFDFKSISDAVERRITEDAARFVILREKVTDAKVRWIEAEYVKVNFFAYYGIDDARYTADAEYAKGFANALYEGLRSGTLTVAQAITQTEDDDRIGTKSLVEARNWTAYGFGGTITREDALSYTPGESDFADAIFAAEIDLNAPKVIRTLFIGSSGELDETSEPVEATILILNVTRINEGAYLTYEAWREALMQNLGVEAKL